MEIVGNLGLLAMTATKYAHSTASGPHHSHSQYL